MRSTNDECSLERGVGGPHRRLERSSLLAEQDLSREGMADPAAIPLEPSVAGGPERAMAFGAGES